ncbi:MAG: TonB-dependent receptor [bacterium]|nr:TonB-dependent receptor [bacterium]
MHKIIISVLVNLIATSLFGQLSTISGTISHDSKPIEFANVYLVEAERGAITNANGSYFLERIRPGSYTLRASFVGFKPVERKVEVVYGEDLTVNIELEKQDVRGDEIVVTGTLKEISRAKSPVPVEVFSPAYFKMNPTPSLYDAMQNVNGVRPQLNCSVCNTGDIHINGLEGPYTMVLIDGMPIVSGLSTVYGLSGIPNSMIERVEIVKGPASTLYGSEAVGGLINVITKKPSSAPTFMVDGMTSNWMDLNLDLGGKFAIGKNVDVLTGVNVFNYTNPVDHNNDGFTDITIQERASLFQKWSIQREEGRLFTIAGRYLYEDRWGGEMDWTKQYRGGTEIYGESIYTRRWELISNYQLPTTEKLLLSLSYNQHTQDSFYGDMGYLADQRIGFAQLTWDTQIKNHSIMVGSALRYTYYDDDTPATASSSDVNINQPDEVWLPGIFVQNDITLNEENQLLLGMRYDHNSRHGNIFTPRLAYKWSPNVKNIFRFNAGTGFRVVNLFTEDHAVLTGGREVIIEEELEPEQSYNVNLNYEHKIFGDAGRYIGFDASVWYTWFNNQILPDYETNSNQIIYANLDGHGVTQGVSLNVDVELPTGIKMMAGGSFIDVYTSENDVRTRPLLTERWTGTWAIGVPVGDTGLKIDYTGNIYGPMRLPVLNEMDPRPAESGWWSLQNIQFTWQRPNSQLQVYGGVKNLLNFTPPANSIARSFDPFDEQVQFDGNGNVMATPNNPHALTFDPSYVFAPNQGIRGFLGIRYIIR